MDKTRQRAEFHVQGSEADPYKVVFIREFSTLKAHCNCKAGKNGQLCKHRLAILDGDPSSVVSENRSQIFEVLSWIEGSEVADLISEVAHLEIEKKAIEDKIKVTKKLLAKSLL